MQGNKIATHKGIANYTLGQRRGVGFAGGKPLYVGKIDAEKNTIALGTRDEVSFRSVSANQVNVLIPEELVTDESRPSEGLDKQVYGRIRSYGTPPASCKVIELSETDMTVEFDEPQFAPCPGQKLVLYNSEGYVMAGGTIVSAFGNKRADAPS
jgi:tRNA-specific 2-thiouridylase